LLAARRKIHHCQKTAPPARMPKDFTSTDEYCATATGYT